MECDTRPITTITRYQYREYLVGISQLLSLVTVKHLHGAVAPSCIVCSNFNFCLAAAFTLNLSTSVLVNHSDQTTLLCGKFDMSIVCTAKPWITPPHAYYTSQLSALCLWNSKARAYFIFIRPITVPTFYNRSANYYFCCSSNIFVQFACGPYLKLKPILDTLN